MGTQFVLCELEIDFLKCVVEMNRMLQSSVSQTVVRRPQVVLGFCPCGPFRLKISPKKTEKIKLT